MFLRRVVVQRPKRSRTLSSCASAKFRIGYCTDCEGNYDHFLQYARMSEVLHVSENTGGARVTKKGGENTYFVYGGDVCDHRNGDIRIAQQLLALKLAHPENVFIVMGNRDANKMRFTSELHQSEIRPAPLPCVVNSPPHWQPWAYTYETFVTNLADADEAREKIRQGRSGGNGSDGSDESERMKVLQFVPVQMRSKNRAVQRHNTRVNRLKWMLRCTMGAPLSFECRREELLLLENRSNGKGKGTKKITDDQVVHSFVGSVSLKPATPMQTLALTGFHAQLPRDVATHTRTREGWMAELLQHMQLCVIIGNTLFVHGALHEGSLGYVPPMASGTTSGTSSSTSSSRDLQAVDVRAWAGRTH